MKRRKKNVAVSEELRHGVSLSHNYVSSRIMSRKIRFTFILQLVSKKRNGDSEAATSSLGCVIL